MLSYIPETVRIDITGRCNLRCLHCQADMFLGKKHLELTTDQWKAVFRELAELGAVTLGFLGGEPFLRKDFIELVQYASSLGLKTTVTTNGTAINRLAVETLVKETDTYMVFSLDGPNSKTHDAIRGAGTFAKTVDSILKVSNLQNKVGKTLLGISAVLHKGNSDCFSDFFALSKDLGVNSLSIAVVHNTGRAKENWQQLELPQSRLLEISELVARKANEYRDILQLRLDMFPAAYREFLDKQLGIKIPHEVLMDVSGVRECYIQHDGKVFPSQQCSEMIPNVLSGAHVAGISFDQNSLKSTKFKDIWYGAEFHRYRATLLQRAYIDKLRPCSNCKFRHSFCQPSMGQVLKGQEISHPLCDFVGHKFSNLTSQFGGPALEAADVQR